MKQLFLLLLSTSLFSLSNAQTTCTVYTEANSDIPNDVIPALALAPNGSIWVGTSYDGLGIFDGNSWTHYTESNSGLPYYSVNDIEFDSDGLAWIATGKGVATFDGTNWTVYDSSNTIIPGRYITAIDIDDNDKVWIESLNGSFDYQPPVSFDGTNWENVPEMPTNAKGDRINEFIFDDDIVWMASDAGVLKLENNSFTFYPKAVTDLWRADVGVKDVNGDIWFAGFTGLLKRTATAWDFLDHEDAFDFPQNTPYNTILPYSDHLWISYYSGIMKFNKTTEAAVFYTPENSCLPDVTRFNEMVRENDGTFWIASLDGLIEFDVESTNTGFGTNNTYENGLSLFPNPSNGAGRITISTDKNLISGFSLYRIHNVTGKIVQQGQASSTDISINVSGLQKGHYTLELLGNGQAVSKSFIVN